MSYRISIQKCGKGYNHLKNLVLDKVGECRYRVVGNAQFRIHAESPKQNGSLVSSFYMPESFEADCKAKFGSVKAARKHAREAIIERAARRYGVYCRYKPDPDVDEVSKELSSILYPDVFVQRAPVKVSNYSGDNYKSDSLVGFEFSLKDDVVENLEEVFA